ncbi:MAG: ABC transporter substrate-binding protein [Deltaproteobacteria bacterium]|nr:ABC transporter substrate-binding protein [Deltaproteobacteria bacterium]
MLQGKMVKKPVGLGPFTLKSLKENTFIFLVKNEHFFGKGKIISGRELGPYIDGVIFKLYETLSNATLALKNRQIDFLWKGVSQAFVEDLIRDPNIIVPMTLDSGYRYLAFNLRRIPMSDPSFRRAVAYLIDKDFITKQILHDHGQRIDTFVPPLNTFYYNANTPVYGRGMDRKARTQKAYSILTAAGYIWKTPPLDANGSLEKGLGLTMPDGKPIPSLTLKTPSAEYDTEIAATGQLIQEWLRNFGIPVSWETMAFDGLVQKVRNSRDFDMFLLGWRNLSFDPDYLRRFFHSSYDRPNAWNYTGYINAEFDLMADLQAKTLVPEERKKIVMRLQAQLMDDLPYVPLYVPHRMEGVRIDRLSGWVSQVGGVGNIWSFCLLRPGGN